MIHIFSLPFSIFSRRPLCGQANGIQLEYRRKGRAAKVCPEIFRIHGTYTGRANSFGKDFWILHIQDQEWDFRAGPEDRRPCDGASILQSKDHKGMFCLMFISCYLSGTWPPVV